MRIVLLAFMASLALAVPALAAKLTCINAFSSDSEVDTAQAFGPNLFESVDPTQDVDPASTLGIALVVVSTVGIENFIGLYETEATSGACAARDFEDHRAIWVNPLWFEEYSGGDYWIKFGVIAHEVGHHLNDHTSATSGDQWQREYQADKFVGRAVKIIGGTLNDALKTVAQTSLRGSHSHPNRSVRETAIRDGFNMTFQIPRSVVVLTTDEAIQRSEEDPGRVSVVGGLGWSYVGIFKDGAWQERVFYQLSDTPDDMPEVEDVIKASTDVNVRISYPFRTDDGKWQWPEVVGIVGANNVVRIKDIEVIPNGNVWAQVERLDGGTP